MTNAITRRTVLFGSASLAAMVGLPALSQPSPPIHVIKGRGCACCNSWVAYLRESGFTVTAEEQYPGALVSMKLELGIPQGAFSCHTGLIDGYVLEGHVPVADIRRLVETRPEALGLSVPGMPYGSPGMGPEDQRDAYDVLLIGRDGSTEIFTHYPAA